MSLIKKLERIIEESQKEADKAVAGDFAQVEEYKEENSSIIGKGDNLKFMKYLSESLNMDNKLKLIYIDPPFFSGANYEATIELGDSKIKYKAYDDKWNKELDEYLIMLTTRLIIMKELLAPDGLIWVHLDWHAAHYVKIIMDEIFGSENFLNEIIWTYKSGGSSKKHFSRKHDNLLLYSKSPKYSFYPLKEKSYNRGLKPYRFKGVAEYKDDTGWYTMVNMKDVWEIDMVGRTSGERTGYATQKPESLLERIIESSSKEGDICADFFSGSGTLAKVSARLNRPFICCDESSLAVECSKMGLMKKGAGFKAFSMGDERVCFDAVLSMKKDSSGNENFLIVDKLKYNNINVMFKEDIRSDVLKAYNDNSLNLLAFITIDFDFQGKIHKSQAVYFYDKKRGLPPIKISKGKTFQVKLVDVFGNICFKRFENEGDN